MRKHKFLHMQKNVVVVVAFFYETRSRKERRTYLRIKI